MAGRALNPACQACVGVGVQYPHRYRHGSVARTLTLYLPLDRLERQAGQAGWQDRQDRPSPGLTLPYFCLPLHALQVAPSCLLRTLQVDAILSTSSVIFPIGPLCRPCAYRQRKDAPSRPSCDSFEQPSWYGARTDWQEPCLTEAGSDRSPVTTRRCASAAITEPLLSGFATEEEESMSLFARLSGPPWCPPLVSRRCPRHPRCLHHRHEVLYKTGAAS